MNMAPNNSRAPSCILPAADTFHTRALQSTEVAFRSAVMLPELTRTRGGECMTRYPQFPIRSVCHHLQCDRNNHVAATTTAPNRPQTSGRRTCRIPPAHDDDSVGSMRRKAPSVSGDQRRQHPTACARSASCPSLCNVGGGTKPKPTTIIITRLRPRMVRQKMKH